MTENPVGLFIGLLIGFFIGLFYDGLESIVEVQYYHVQNSHVYYGHGVWVSHFLNFERHGIV